MSAVRPDIEKAKASGRPDGFMPNPKLKLLDQVSEVMRFKHDSIRTERTYRDWVRRYIRFHRMRSREDLHGAERKIEEFLGELAVNGHVAASTQNQAFNALLSFPRRCCTRPWKGYRRCGPTGQPGCPRSSQRRRSDRCCWPCPACRN